MKKPPSIAVAGDVTVDWLVRSDVDWLAAARHRGDAGGDEARRHQNWQLRRGTRMEARPGGALLLAREIALALAGATPRPDILTHQLRNPRNVSPDKVLHSVVELEGAPGGDRRLRVARYLGFSGPIDGAPAPLPVARDDPAAAMVVLDDAGNGFRDHPEVWPRAIMAPGKTPLVVMKVSRPLSGGPLFERVRSAHQARLTLVINADDLRAEGVNISRQLSWERSAREFLWQIRHNPDLELLRGLPNVLVRFDLDGVIHYSGTKGASAARLFYDPQTAEGGWRERAAGGMLGITDVFVAALVAQLHTRGPGGIAEGIREGIVGARRFFLRGIEAGTMEYPGAEIFAPSEGGDGVIADAVIPASVRRDAPDPDFWSLLTELRGPGLERLARQLVVEGETAALRTVPVGEFGALRTVDRAEIESYRGIRNLIAEYLIRPSKRPLSIAVFGPPGSGKSFGVEQVAQSVARLTSARVEKLEFNLSQFESGRDLTSALHRVRDEVLRGRVPLVFFDEFDSPREGPLGWLRAFLAPMQDGAFKDGEGMHPVGRAIFVFAGGLSDTLARFAREQFDDRVSAEARRAERARFRDAKGPDFVSRLRGYVNVLGPNPDPRRPQDGLYLIRRATILRSLLLRNCPHLADPARPRHLRVDEGVLRALIGVPLYRHGVRSMEAILDMSRIEGRSSFEPAALPSPDQLDQHVGASEFSALVLQGVLFEAAKDAIAEALHARYRETRGKTGRRRDPALAPWSELDEVYRRSNAAQAEDILRKLELVGCGYRPRSGRRGAAFRFRPEEIERLAEREHERYTQERRDQGFQLGPSRNLTKKTSPYLVPWDRLSDAARRLDRQAVAAIPDVLARAGFEVYRLTP